MSDLYQVRPLAPPQVAQAYPLISIFDPGLSQDQWSNYAGALMGAEGRGTEHAVLTVQSSQNHIHGLPVYWVRPDLRRGRVCEIENFVVVDITGNRAAAQVLLDFIEQLALEFDCSCVTLSLLNPQMRRWLREPRNPAMDLFRAAGFRGEQLRLRKCFVPEQGPEQGTA